MKHALFLFALIGFISCETSKTTEKKTIQIPNGEYYSENAIHDDTVYFQNKRTRSIIRSWSVITWEFTQDSLFRNDRKGMYGITGGNNCSYQLSSDTLTLDYLNFNRVFRHTENKEDEKGTPRIEKFRVITQNNSLLTLVRVKLPKQDKYPVKLEQIDSNIQLR